MELSIKRFLRSLVALSMIVGAAGQTKADYVFTTLDVVAAYGINDSGQIVGLYDGQHGFLYSDGRYSLVDVPGAMNTAAVGINNAGKIVGAYDGHGSS